MILNAFNKYFLSSAVPILLLLFGIFITIRLRGFYFLHPIRSIKLLLKKEPFSSTSPLSALCLALAGTLGVGNIVGVASAISLGGVGSIFWLWVSALLAMSLKYAEIVLSIKYRKRTDDGYSGGAAYYIFTAFKSLKMQKIGRAMAYIFSALCIMNSLSMGCMLQSNAISSSFEYVFGTSPLLVGLITAALFLGAIFYKSGKVEKITGVIVPIMSLLYIAVTVVAIYICRDGLIEAFSSIFDHAFNMRSASGGILGFLTSQAFKSGSVRGLVSNEAGAGTAPTAHALSDTEIPEKQGLMGVFEVFADTIILCTLTALVIILSGADTAIANPMIIIVNAFSAILGSGANYFLCISVFLFAYATLICWARYGLLSLEYITHRPTARIIYIVAFATLTVLGTVFTSNIIWDTSDFSIGMMTLINLVALFILRRDITAYKFNKR